MGRRRCKFGIVTLTLFRFHCLTVVVGEESHYWCCSLLKHFYVEVSPRYVRSSRREVSTEDRGNQGAFGEKQEAGCVGAGAAERGCGARGAGDGNVEFSAQTTKCGDDCVPANFRKNRQFADLG